MSDHPIYYGVADHALQDFTPLLMTEERHVEPGDTFTATWEAPAQIEPFNARWILVRTDA